MSRSDGGGASPEPLTGPPPSRLRDRGQIAAGADVDDLSAVFATALIGVSAAIRAEATEEQVQAACRVATSVLDA